MTKTEEIILKEEFKVDDSHSKVRGFVFAYDEDGNLIFTKENMIVKSGRRFIMNNGIQDGCFSAAFLSENMDMVTEDDNDTKIGTYQANKVELFDGLTIDNFDSWSAVGKNLEDLNYFNYLIDYQNLVIKCLIVFNDLNSIEANSLGLIAKYPSTFGDDTLKDKEVLFSRLTFPTYYKSPTQRLTFKYYIYF